MSVDLENSSYDADGGNGDGGDVSNDAPGIITVNVLANTGVQTAFVPITGSRDVQSKVTQLPGVPKLQGRELQDFRKLAATDGWRTSEVYPWMRVRAARRDGSFVTDEGDLEEVSINGFHIAIETNLGVFSRGYVLSDRSMKAVAESIPDALLPPYLPFAAAEEGDLLRSDIKRINIADAFGYSKAFKGLKPGAWVNIDWKPAQDGTISVDLVVDFGNSRTNAMLVEYLDAQEGNLSRICQPVSFADDNGVPGVLKPQSDSLDNVLPESWFALKEPTFQTGDKVDEQYQHYTVELDKAKLFKKQKRIVTNARTYSLDMFKELSPAVMGPQAKVILRDRIEGNDGLTHMSSPKRYAWDKRPLSATNGGLAAWYMHKNFWNCDEDKTYEQVPLAGEFFRFFDREQSDWFIPSDDAAAVPPYARQQGQKPVTHPATADHPHSTGLALSALSIIERAYRQVNSSAYRSRAAGTKNKKRRIENIVLTVPPGWTIEEGVAFQKQWMLAAETFFLSRYMVDERDQASESAPAISCSLDEALAAQLPFIYYETQHLSGDAYYFLELFGRKNSDGDHSVRVMTIDIGGGTTDTCIAEYRDLLESGDNIIEYDPMFKDSSTIAGDALVKRLIEEVLLPSFLEPDTPRDIKASFAEYFASQAPEKGSLNARIVFIPIILHWIREIVQEGNNFSARIDEISGVEMKQVEAINKGLRARNLQANEIRTEFPLRVDKEAIMNVITEWLKPIVETHSNLSAIFDVDLIVLTGKPSEIPLVREMVVKNVPLSPNRILSAKNYYAGNTAPLNQGGELKDAKLVTALGASIYQAMRRKQIPAWNIQKRPRDAAETQRHYWGLVGGRRGTFEKERPPFMHPDDNQAQVIIGPTKTYIGRALFLHHSQPEPVYQVRWLDEDNPNQPSLLRLTLNRAFPNVSARKALELAEGLRFVKVEGQYDNDDWVELPPETIDFSLCTLRSGTMHWMDSGEFSMSLS